MDRLDELTVFAAVLDAGSLTGAAGRLRRSAPAITRALAALEARLGVRLIERTTRRLIVTEAGRRFAHDARQILAAYAAAMQQTDVGEPHGLLRVTAPLIFGRRYVTPLVAGFLQAHPAIQADLLLSDRNLDLIDEQVDVALRIGPIFEGGLTAIRVGEVRRVVVASPDYVATHGEPRRPGELSRHGVLFVATRPIPREWRFREAGRDRIVRLTPQLTVNEIESALVAARAGHGITRVLSYQVADELADGTLRRLLTGFEPPPLPVSLVTAAGGPTPARAGAFLAHAEQSLRTLSVIQPDHLCQ